MFGGLRVCVTRTTDREYRDVCHLEPTAMTSSALARRTRLAILSITLTGCSLFTDATGKPSISLSIQKTDDLGIVAPVAGVTDGEVVIRGTFSTPCLGYAVRADAKQKGGALEVALRGRQVGEICLTAIGRFRYTAIVSGVPAGSTRVTVRRVIEDANWPIETVVDTTLRVP